MSYHAVIMDLLSGIDDPGVRMEVTNSLYFLKNVFSTGKVPEDQIRDDIYDIVVDVLRLKMPMATEEEIDRTAKEYVEKIMQAIRLETLSTRLLQRRRISFTV